MNQLEWLMNNGGSVIRWRVGNELIQDITDTERTALACEVLKQPFVQGWLDRLTLGNFPVALDALDVDSLRILGNMVHGGKAVCLENVFGKLAEFGLQAGMPALDKRALPLMRIFAWKPDWKDDATFQNAWDALKKSAFAWGLLRLGYSPDSAMMAFLKEHLSTCHKIVHDQVFDIYAGEAELAGLPKSLKGKPIIKQEVMANYWLPYIHDLYVFAFLPVHLRNSDIDRKIDDFIAYILDHRFQALREGYVYAWIKDKRTCYSWGWSSYFKMTVHSCSVLNC